MKDLGCLTYFLGLKFYNSSSSIYVSQQKYAQDFIALVGIQDSSPINTLLEVNVKFQCDEGDLLPNMMLYRQLVGSLNYRTITWPDISFTVQQVNHYM